MLLDLHIKHRYCFTVFINHLDSEDDEEQYGGEDRHDDDDDHLFEFDLFDEDEETVDYVRTPEPLEPLDVLGPRTRTLSLTSNSSAGNAGPAGDMGRSLAFLF